MEVIVEPFSAMNHGFFTRGHMEDPEIEAEVRFLVEFGINSEITTAI